MKLAEIGYTRGGIAKKWGTELADCKSREDLIAVCERWPELCADALEAAKAEGFDFADFDKARKLEARGRFAGEEAALKYGAILLPERLLMMSMIATLYCVPEGLAVRRLADAGWPKPPKIAP